MARPQDLLILNYPSFSERAEELFTRLNESEALAMLFVENPSAVITEIMFKEQIPLSSAQVNQCNRLLFSMLTNPGFMGWASTYQKTLEGQVKTAKDRVESDKLLTATLDRGRIYTDVVEAFQKYVDKELLYSMMITDPEQKVGPISSRVAPPTPQWQPVYVEIFVAVAAVVAVVVVVTQIDATPYRDRAGITREDLRRVSEFISDGLKARARQLRDSGALTSPDRLSKSSVS